MSNSRRNLNKLINCTKIAIFDELSEAAIKMSALNHTGAIDDIDYMLVSCMIEKVAREVDNILQTLIGGYEQ